MSLTILSADLSILASSERARLLSRGDRPGAPVQDEVRAIIAAVRERGDGALREMARRFDGVELDRIEVPPADWHDALVALQPAVRSALEDAAAAIRAFHATQIPMAMEMEVRPGVRIGRRSEPLASVGVYAPGGRAAYPSSVLMGVIPARIAGVGEIVVCSPAGTNGRPSSLVLAACAIAGADRVYAAGGAGAIAALALGTAAVRRVAKIVGPGNAYVTEAKQQLSGVVGIDSPAGPSEILVLADASADPGLIAVELLAQAEHDPDAAAVAILVRAPGLAARVRIALEEMVPEQPRRDIVMQSFAARGALLDAASLDDALRFAAEYAPEHLCLMIEDARAVLPRVRCAGTVFLGSSSSVAFGDYMTGANHVLPTGGLARSFSGLGTTDFLRFVTYQEVDATAAAAMSRPTQVLAEAEGLPAHALAARMRAAVPAAPAGGPALRPQFAGIELYDPRRAPCAVDLSDNTNLHGVPPRARAVLESADLPSITRYPSVYATRLKRAAADRHGVSPENIATGCGSDDILDSVIRAFCDPGAAVAFPTPTFGVVDLLARMNGARPVPVPHASGLALDVDALARTRAAVTYICRPNNPTGTLYSRASIERAARAVAGVLVIDEAYADYAGEDMTSLAMESGRILIVRTLSKAYGLAGLRVGYAVGCTQLIAEVEKARGPYKVGGIAEAAAVTALTDDGAWVLEQVHSVRANRERLFSELCSAGFDPLPSHANFLLVPVSAPLTGNGLAAVLRAQGVAVRPFQDLPGIGDALRVTIGPWPVMERFMAVLIAATSSRPSEAGVA